jgi:hypothetical protein
MTGKKESRTSSSGAIIALAVAVGVQLKRSKLALAEAVNHIPA